MATQVDMGALVQGLRDVFMSGRTRSAEWRIEQLNGLIRFLNERTQEIVEALKQDLGKPEHETKTMEMGQVLYAATNLVAQVKEYMEPEKMVSRFPDLKITEIVPEPLGVVLIIAPWNFPFVLCLEPLAGAIAAGNCAVIKPSEICPASSAVMAKFLPLYLDKTAIKVVEGGIPESTALLNEQWDKIFYTGNTKVGRIVMASAAKHLTPVILELGGKSPTIVDSTVDLDVAARRISRGKWAVNYGQVCVAPDYVLAEESIASELAQKFKETLLQFYGEDPSTQDLTRIVSLNHFKRLTGLLNDEKTAEKVIHGGQVNEKALYISPTVILNPSLDSPVMQEEIFGPILVIITVKDVDEAIKLVNSRPKPLALYLFSTDEKVVDKVIHMTSSGGVTVNDVLSHVRDPALPFGGVGESGMGSYHGKHTFYAFSHMKSVAQRDLTGDDASTFPSFTKVQ